MEGFSSLKDTDREILLKLSDKELIKTCSLNKYLFRFVCDDNFFRRKLLLSYPDTLKYFNQDKDKNYKNYYLKVVYYVSKLYEDFKYLYVSGDFEKQYNIFKQVSKEVIVDNKKQLVVDYQKLLVHASKNGELDLVKEALKKGANISDNNEEALRMASIFGRLEIVKYLVERGANIHIANEEPLIGASLNGQLEVIKYLVSIGANASVNNYEPLRWARQGGKIETIKYLESLNN